MAVFAYVPDFPAQESTAPRFSLTAYPSYEQRTTFGINSLQDTWDLTFSGRTSADRDDIYNFLKARAGIEPFEWETPFGETGSFICSSWDTTLDSCNYNTIRATFELQYVPAGPNLVLPEEPNTAFSYLPEFSAQHSFDSRARITQFGDGYRQRIIFGLQPQEENWQLSFQNRTNAERDQIRNYLRGTRGVKAFAWTDPRSGQVGAFVCSEWNIEYINFNNSSVNATFRRVFEPTSSVIIATNELLPTLVGTYILSGQASTLLAPAFDPYFDSVVVLLHMNGADESTTIVNSAPTGFSISNPSSKIDTAQSKFGGASCRPSFSGMQTASDSSPNYLTNPFTQEAWIYIGQHGTRRQIVRIGTTDPGIYITTAGLLVVEVGSAGNIVITGASVTTNTWHHVALCRGFPSANDHRLYLNGVQTGGTWTNPYTISSSMFVYVATTGFDGTNQWIDEVRVTKGVCRYTGTFTPPTAPFPNAGS